MSKTRLQRKERKKKSKTKNKALPQIVTGNKRTKQKFHQPHSFGETEVESQALEVGSTFSNTSRPLLNPERPHARSKATP